MSGDAVQALREAYAKVQAENEKLRAFVTAYDAYIQRYGLNDGVRGADTIVTTRAALEQER